MNIHQNSYLPNDVPSIGRIIILGLQHALTMFPATALVAILVGFDVGTVLVGSGLATISALLLSRIFIGKYIPLYYGASFSYIAAIAVFTQPEIGIYAGENVISEVQAGIIASGIINIFVGIVLSTVGKQYIEYILPPIISGMVALVIGLSLSGAALDLASQNWTVSLCTLSATVVFSITLRDKGFFGLIPVILGIITGCLISIPFGLLETTHIQEARWLRLPLFTLPNFTSPRTWEIILGVSVISIATIPESTAHLYQISLYIDKLADDSGREKYHLSSYVGLNLILDGIADITNGILGGLGGTNYGENNSLMAITKNFSGPVLIFAGTLAVFMGFLGKLAAIIQSIPVAVTGGLSIYLFGIIAMQGIAIVQAAEIDLFDPKQLALGATVGIIGLGGYIAGEGVIEFEGLQQIFPTGVPSIAVATVVGILLNLIISIFQSLPNFE